MEVGGGEAEEEEDGDGGGDDDEEEEEEGGEEEVGGEDEEEAEGDVRSRKINDSISWTMGQSCRDFLRSCTNICILFCNIRVSRPSEEVSHGGRVTSSDIGGYATEARLGLLGGICPRALLAELRRRRRLNESPLCCRLIPDARAFCIYRGKNPLLNIYAPCQGVHTHTHAHAHTEENRA